jgi:hypothetical protein
MRTVPAPPVGLKRAFHAMEPRSVRKRNPNSIRLPSLCQPGERVLEWPVSFNAAP